MAASRRVYVGIAAALKGVRPEEPEDALSNERRIGWEDAVVAVADALEDDNANFQREKFYAAAGHQVRR